MQLLIDNREPKELINYLNFLNSESKNKIEIIVKPLVLGDGDLVLAETADL